MINKPRLEDKFYCTACGKTALHRRDSEEDSWICLICNAKGSQRKQRDQRDNNQKEN